jgi:hypothetical protein
MVAKIHFIPHYILQRTKASLKIPPFLSAYPEDERDAGTRGIT